MSQLSAGASPLPRALVVLGLPLACLMLVLLFGLALFPYGRFRDVLVGQIGAATGAYVELTELDGGLSLGGPGLTARGLRLRWPDGNEIALDRVRVRPAWSTSWLSGSPALAVALEGDVGRMDGTLWPGDAPGFAGDLEGVAVDRLPLASLLGFAPLTGVADATLDLRAAAGGRPEGSIDFDAREGALTLPDLPIAIPFASLSGSLRFADDGGVELEDVVLDGPMLALHAKGSLGAAPRLSAAPLDVQVEIQVVDPTLRPAVASWGVRLDDTGKATLHLTGTPDQPRVR